MMESIYSFLCNDPFGLPKEIRNPKSKLCSTLLEASQNNILSNKQIKALWQNIKSNLNLKTPYDKDNLFEDFLFVIEENSSRNEFSEILRNQQIEETILELVIMYKDTYKNQEKEAIAIY